MQRDAINPNTKGIMTIVKPAHRLTNQIILQLYKCFPGQRKIGDFSIDIVPDFTRTEKLSSPTTCILVKNVLQNMQL